MDDRGWTPFPFDEIPTDYRERLTAETRQNYQTTLRDAKRAELPDRALRDILETCRAKGIRVALYRMPEGSRFREWTNEQYNEAMRAYLLKLQSEYDLMVCDASRWLPDDAFSDGHHLMRAGAVQFTERFGQHFLIEWLTTPTRRAVAFSSASSPRVPAAARVLAPPRPAPLPPAAPARPATHKLESNPANLP
jgi:hypothetical protein